MSLPPGASFDRPALGGRSAPGIITTWIHKLLGHYGLIFVHKILA